MYSGSYSNSNSQSNSYSNGYSSGYGNYESSADKMANIGAGLKKQTFDLATLPKFEKNFYREAESVARRSERDVEAFRNKKEIRVSGKHIPRPVETFDEAGFPSMSPLQPILSPNLSDLSSICP
jgi:ATP-dependent RNA helicase DDX5/DBP2